MTSTFSSTNRWTFFFLGLDNNQFAVEVAKVTMMMAKKLAADELDEHIDALPLDNEVFSLGVCDSGVTGVSGVS
jgi:hypothetical protein